MLKLFNRYFLLIILSMSLSGCLFGRHGYIHNREDAYLQSKSLPAIHLPPDLQPVNMQAAYPIPDSKAFSERKAPSLIPPGNAGDLISPKQKKQSLVNANSVLGQDSQGFTELKIVGEYRHNWDKVKKLLVASGYQVIGSDQKTGIIEAMSPVSKKQTSAIYQFKLSQSENGTLVEVLDSSGGAVSTKLSQPILLNIKQQLGK